MQLIGSSFQIQVWKELLKIPYGQKETFSQIALRIAGLKSKKVLQSPCAQNMLNIIVPCHRVMKKENIHNLYAGKKEKKEFLLNL